MCISLVFCTVGDYLTVFSSENSTLTSKVHMHHQSKCILVVNFRIPLYACNTENVHSVGLGHSYKGTIFSENYGLALSPVESLSGVKEEGLCLGTSRDFRALSREPSLEPDLSRDLFCSCFFPEDLKVGSSRSEDDDLLPLGSFLRPERESVNQSLPSPLNMSKDGLLTISQCGAVKVGVSKMAFYMWSA